MAKTPATPTDLWGADIPRWASSADTIDEAVGLAQQFIRERLKAGTVGIRAARQGLLGGSVAAATNTPAVYAAAEYQAAMENLVASPSRAAHEAGRALIQGFADGLTGHEGEALLKRLRTLAEGK
jgi:hypothetical protein